MKIIGKKAAAFALVGAITLGGVSPSVVRADTNSDLAAQVNALLAQIATLQSQIAALQGNSVHIPFISDLTVGSRGDEVSRLQSFLESKGFLVMPVGVAKGYFGALTRTAVAAYQSAKGITPAAGYFGPVTRAQVNAELKATTPGTGTNPGNGNTTPPAQNGREGDISTDLLGTPSSEDVEKGESDVKVLGFEIEADDSDMVVERVDVNFTAKDTSKGVRPWRYFEEVSLFVGNKKIAEVDAKDRGDWNERNDTYQLRFSNLKETIKKGDVKEMYIAVSTLRAIDSDDIGQEWKVVIPTDGIRARDTLNLVQYSGNLEQTFTIDDRSSGDLKLRKANNSPKARVVEADNNSVTNNVALLDFTLEGRSRDVEVSDLAINLSTNSLGTGSLTDLVSTVYLYKGNTRIASENVASTSVNFDRLRLKIDKDKTETYSIRADIKRLDGTRNAEGITLSARVTGIKAENAQGDRVSYSGSAAGEEVAFYTKGIQVALESASEKISTEKSGPDRATFTIKFKVTAFGDDMYIGRATTEDNDGTYAAGSGVNFSITNPGDNTTTATLSSSADRMTNTYRIREGRTETFTLTVVGTATSSNFAAVALEAINWGLTDSAAQNDFYTFNLDMFKTDPVFMSQ